MTDVIELRALRLVAIVGVLLLVFLLGQFSGYNDLHLYRRWR
jgi:hypothetical protein